MSKATRSASASDAAARRKRGRAPDADSGAGPGFLAWSVEINSRMESGDALLPDHGVGDRVAITTEVGDDQRFVVIPVVPLQALPSAAPATDLGTHDQAKLLRERGGVARRARADASWSSRIVTDLEMAAET